MSDYTREIWVRVFLLAVWLSLSAGGLAILDPGRDTALLAVVLLAVIAGLAVTRPFPGSHLAFAGVAAVAYALIHGIRASSATADPLAPHLPAAGAGAFAMAVSAIVGDQIRRAFRDYDAELRTRQHVIEEIESIEARTGAVKQSHAERILNTEIVRSRRYGRSCSLVALGPDDWDELVDERGADDVQGLILEMSSEFLQNLRQVDVLIHTGRGGFIALLPETDLEGATVVAEKLAGIGSEIMRAEVRAGIATFPDDDVSGEGLIRESQEALNFAREASIVVASRSLLG